MVIEKLNSYNEQDLADLKELMSQLSERLKLQQSDIDRVLTDENCMLYVMRNDRGNIIATAALSIFNSLSSKKASIEDVIVHHDYRGRHLGRAIVAHIIEEAKMYGNIELQLTSKPKRVAANQLYQSLGFNIKETNFYRMIL